MSKSSIIDRLEHWLNRFIKFCLVMLVAIGVPAVLYVGLRAAVMRAANAHWIFGLVLSCVFSLLLFAGLIYFWTHRRSILKEHPQVFLTLLLAIILVSASVFSSLSFILYQAGNVQYNSDISLTPGGLSDFYMWYFIDTIPVLELWSTFDVANPVEADGFWAASLVFVFRLSIIIPSVMLLKEWLDFRKKQAFLKGAK